MRAEEIKGLMEAYSHVYETPEVLSEEVVEEDLEQLMERGAPTDPKARAAYDANVAKNRAALGNTLLYGNAAGRKPEAPITRNRNVRGGGVIKPSPTAAPKTSDSATKSKFAGARDAAFAKAKQIKGSPVVGSAPAAPKLPAPSSTTPTKSSTSTPTKPSTPTAPTKPAGSAMDQWAKANPKLAAAKAERDRTRGTSATTNPLMKDMKDKLPAPSSPSPSTAKTGFDLAKKGVNLAADVDIFDLVKGHLLDEGYAETEENALVMMANMSEEWRQSIIEELLGEGKKEFPHKKVDRQVYDAMDSGETAGDSGDSDKEKRDYNRAEKMRSVAAKHGGKSRVKEDVDINEKMEKWIQKVIDESSKTDDGTRARIKMFAGKKGISFEPGPSWDPSANRGKGAHLSDKQMEKQRRKKLRQEDLEAWVDELIAEGYDLSDYTWEEVAEIYAQELELSEAQRARENPEGHEKEDKKYEKVRGEKTPMPPRGDKRREDFEKWYRANVR
jgi:hypothetical protein